MRNLYIKCRQWERTLLTKGWQAPIDINQIRLELTEAEEGDEVEELGDVLQVLFRYAERRGIDLEASLQRSLNRNMVRTDYVLNNFGMPRDANEMAQYWKRAKDACATRYVYERTDKSSCSSI